MASFLNKLWYEGHSLQWALVPFSFIYQVVTRLRRLYLSHFCQFTCPVPLIVVGNLTVGGAGKTPLVIELARKIEQKGLKVGIVSRGYGSTLKFYPYEVQLDDDAQRVGDEPLMIAQKTRCPVIIAPKRVAAVRYLLQKHQCQIIISDDGLQHYRMGRAIEIVVIDGKRGLGNGHCLPAGPLRETAKRLHTADFIVVNEGSWENAYSMCMIPGKVINLATEKEIDPNLLQKNRVAAVAGIGNPQRFYSTLSQLGIEFNPYYYPDHYPFECKDFNFSEPLIIMTEKDAVKCRSFNSDKMYYLPVEAKLNGAFWDALWAHQQLKGYH